MRHIRARDFGRDEPYIEGVTRIVATAPHVASTATAGNPVPQRHNLDVQLLPGGKLDILVLIEVFAVAVDGDVVETRRDIPIGSAARFRDPDDRLVHPQIGGPYAVVGSSVTIEPHPGLTRRDRRNGEGSGLRELGAGCRGQRQDANDDGTDRHALSHFGSRVLSAAAIKLAARDIALRDLGRYFPDIEGVALAFVSNTTARGPVAQRHDLEIGLLPGEEVDPSRLIKVTPVAVYRDVVLAGRHIAVEGAARLRHPDDRLVHPQLRSPYAVVGSPVAVKPDSRLAGWDRRNWDRGCWRKRSAARRCKRQQRCSEQAGRARRHTVPPV